MRRCPRIRSTLRRVGTHVVNSFSNFLGDDVVSRGVRIALLRAAGARLAPRASLHGGTFFSRPNNLSVGTRSFINRGCYLDLEAPITLHDDVVVGHGTTIITSAHSIGPSGRRADAVRGRPVVIETGAWVAARCVIMPGVTIGAGAVVGSGAVVTHDVPENVLVAGVPARVIRVLTATTSDPDDAGLRTASTASAQSSHGAVVEEAHPKRVGQAGDECRNTGAA